MSHQQRPVGPDGFTADFLLRLTLIPHFDDRARSPLLIGPVLLYLLSAVCLLSVSNVATLSL